MRCLIKHSKIGISTFFSIDQSGNILVADWYDHQIKIFSKEGTVIYTITTDMLPGDQEIYYPQGIAMTRRIELSLLNRTRNAIC